MTPDLRFDPPWLMKARSKLGVHETAGPAATADIVEFHATCTLRATSDEIAWCSAFQNWCLEQVGIAGTKSAAALSWLKWGIELPAPIVGALAVFDWGGGKGHVGMVAGRAPAGALVVLGGNQGDQVKLSVIPTTRLVSLRWPAMPLIDLAAPAAPESTR